MFDDMWELLNNAPYFILAAFAGSFLLTFTTVKVSQSDSVYQWFTGKMEVRRAKQARKIRLEIMADINSFLRGRKEEELPPREQKIYYRILDTYYDKIENLYPSSQKDEGETHE